MGGRLETDKAKALFSALGVFSEEELETRAALYYENYAITVRVEALCLLDMLTTTVLPLTGLAQHFGLSAMRGQEIGNLGCQIEESITALRAALEAIKAAECATVEQAA